MKSPTRTKKLAAIATVALGLGAFSSAHADPLELTYDGASSVISSENLTASALLTDAGSPVEGATVSFEFVGALPATSAEADTDADGVASVDLLADFDAGGYTLTITAGDASTDVAIDVLHRPSHLVYVGAWTSVPTATGGGTPLMEAEMIHNVTNRADVQVIDTLQGTRVSGTKLDCTEDPCKQVTEPLTATFKLGDQAVINGQSGQPFPAAPPMDRTIRSAPIRPATLAFDIPLAIDFHGNSRYAPASLTVPINVWERRDTSEDHAGDVYVNPSRGEFQLNGYARGPNVWYSSGLLTGATVTTGGPAFVLQYEGQDANGDDLSVNAVIRGGTPQAVWAALPPSGGVIALVCRT